MPPRPGPTILDVTARAVDPLVDEPRCLPQICDHRIKELHDGLEIGRTSCGRFWANQLRVLLTAAAYVLMQELRLSGPEGRLTIKSKLKLQLSG